MVTLVVLTLVVATRNAVNRVMTVLKFVVAVVYCAPVAVGAVITIVLFYKVCY